jgi:flagellar basal-body rod protein FlgB
MAITDLPLFSVLRTRMHWHQERQRVLAENVSNANTPEYRPHDLAPPQFGRRPPPAAVSLMRTEGAYIAAASTQFETARLGGYNVRPTGNAVNIEDEMIKVAGNQMDYQAVTTLYQRSLGLLKTAMGKR